MEQIDGLCLDQLAQLQKAYQDLEQYEICQLINDHMKAMRREERLNELGIPDEVGIPRSGI